VQEFKVRVPANCKNVEFTGPNIRRKEVVAQASRLSVPGDGSSSQKQTHGQDARATNDIIWTIQLQDKVWGGYTLVVTYDYQFDAKGATLPVGRYSRGGCGARDCSIAVTTAASLQLNAQSVSDTLRRVDETELSATDRSLVTRAVILAWQYAATNTI